ncbi:MAG: hypothetical protein Q9164_007303 [Protoblastenia rupestris]
MPTTISVQEHVQDARADSQLQLDSSIAMYRSPDVSPSPDSAYSNSGHGLPYTPASSTPGTPLSPTRPPSPEKRHPHQAEGNVFLTALAAQERRVLELKEELHKAESELESLKKQWAAHGVIKKPNEVQHLKQLKPPNDTLVGLTQLREDNSLRSIRESDRRKWVPTTTRAPHRKVFSGSRHTRTLSLLAPKDSTRDSLSFSDAQRMPPLSEGELGSRHVPLSILESTRLQSIIKAPNESYKSRDKDAILESGKQLVGGFRQGLWTFFEDLKQVTVGEEISISSNQTLSRGLTPLSRAPIAENKASSLKEDVMKRPNVHRGSLEKSWHDLGHVPVGIESDLCLSENPTRSASVDTYGLGAHNIVEAISSKLDDDWDNWDLPILNSIGPRHTDARRASELMISPLVGEAVHKQA